MQLRKSRHTDRWREEKKTEQYVFTEKENHSFVQLCQATVKSEHLLNKALVGLLVHSRDSPHLMEKEPAKEWLKDSKKLKCWPGRQSLLAGKLVEVQALLLKWEGLHLNMLS